MMVVNENVGVQDEYEQMQSLKIATRLKQEGSSSESCIS